MRVDIFVIIILFRILRGIDEADFLENRLNLDSFGVLSKQVILRMQVKRFVFLTNYQDFTHDNLMLNKIVEKFQSNIPGFMLSYGKGE